MWFGMLELVNEQYYVMQQVFEENGVRYEMLLELVGEVLVLCVESVFMVVDEIGGQVSVDFDIGQVILLNSYDLMVVCDMVIVNLELMIVYFDIGQLVKFFDVLFEFDDQIQIVQVELKVYFVVVVCFLRNL